MHLSSMLKLNIIFFFLLLCQCKSSNDDNRKRSITNSVECLSRDCILDHNSVIVLLDNKDCGRCTEQVEREANVISNQISKERMILVLKNFDDKKIIAYKRIMTPYFKQILIEGNCVKINSNLKDISHFMIFDRTHNEFISYGPNQFREILSLLKI